jgi:hypothetical protein
MGCITLKDFFIFLNVGMYMGVFMYMGMFICMRTRMYVFSVFTTHVYFHIYIHICFCFGALYTLGQLVLLMEVAVSGAKMACLGSYKEARERRDHCEEEFLRLFSCK